MTFKNGRKIIGKWEKNKLHCKGYIQLANGEKYD